MSDENRESIAAYWLELKQAWESWPARGDLPPLKPETQAYFERITGYYFRESLAALPAGRLGFGEIDNAAAWRIALTYLTVKRPRSSRHLLDDIFERGGLKASAVVGRTEEDELETILNWVLNQFKMRMRDVVRDWVRNEKGTETEIEKTISIETPVGGGSGSDESRSLADFLSPPDDEISELEKKEFRNLAEKPAAIVFDALDDGIKISIYLRAFHRDYGTRVSCEDPRVAEASGIGKSVLSDGRKKALQRAKDEIGRSPAWVESDGVGRYYLECFVTEWMLDLATEWFLRKKPEPLSFLLPPSN